MSPSSGYYIQQRKAWLEEAQQMPADVLVIGGGITGAGVARDAAMRGLRTILIEKADIASGTSSKSSKLIHGGFRYLEQWHFHLVYEALQERYRLMRLAPHLVHAQDCLLPIYRHQKSPLRIHLGMILYDGLALGKNIGRHRMLNASEARRREPLLRQEGLVRAAYYFDGKADDFRLVLATIQSAVQHGARILTYVKAQTIVRTHPHFVIQVRDELNGQILELPARCLVNAAGPWSDRVREALIGQTQPRVRTTKGIHLIVHRKNLPITHAVMVFSPIDQRPIFAIPWKQFVLLGTTDTDYHGDPDWIPVERTDVDYLLTSFQYYFPDCSLKDETIVSTFAGLRPLVFEEGKPASAVTREHALFEAPPGIFTIIGGKLTTYRIMAKQVVDRVVRYLRRRWHIEASPSRCPTLRAPLQGRAIRNWPAFREEWMQLLQDRFNFPPEIAEYLLECYGRDIQAFQKLLEADARAREPIHPDLPFLWGQLEFALRHEFTLALDDFLIRRTHLFSLLPDQAQQLAPTIAREMAQRLHWSATVLSNQMERYRQKVEIVNAFRREKSP